MKAELKHWRAFPANIGLEAASVLEFTNRMALLAVHSTKYRMDSHTLHSGDTMLRRPRLLIVPLSALLFSVFAGIGATPAAPPATLNYQGDLANASSQPVSNGALTMTFRLYDAATAGNLLYSETQTVSVANGLFNVRIGAVTPIALPFDVPYFLGVTVGADAEMTPRQPLSSSAYAFRASNADALAPAATVAGSQITGSITTATIPAANVIGGVGGSGTVTSVATGAGLSGGPITASGAINLAATNLLPTTACAANQIAKWNGSAWICAADDSGSGTVSSVATGAGLSGGPITSAGTINLASTNLLPTTACAANQIPKWNGTAWACAVDDGLPAGGFAGQVLSGSVSGPSWSNSLAVAGDLSLPATSATNGRLLLAGNSFLHGFGSANTFLGTFAGNFTLTGSGNIGVGPSALSSLTTADSNIGIGVNALQISTTGSSNVAIGNAALRGISTSIRNVALGDSALFLLGTGDANIAVGRRAGYNLTAGGGNVYIGHPGASSEDNTLRIGQTLTRAFVSGVRGVTPAGASPLPVVIDADGQLGTGTVDGGGTVTSVATGAGLTGGAITSTGTIGLAATNLLPTTACAANEIPKWSGSAWACAADSSVPAGGVAGQVLIGSAGGPTWSTTISPSGNVALGASTASAGNILKGGVRFLHNSGTNNVFLGESSGNHTLSGARNIGIGATALQASTSGTDNIAMGFNAMNSVTNGSENIAIGTSALANLAGGQANIAIGHNSLQNFTNLGGLNTAVGALSMFATTTGSGNSAFGYAALGGTATGFQNAAFGVSALSGNVSGNNNTAIGYLALSGSQGSENTGVGHRAGSSLTSGSHNIAIANNGVAGESNTVRIGTAPNQTRVFFAGIAGVSPPGGTVLPVVIDANGQLGTGTAGGTLPSGGAVGEVLVGSAGGPAWSTTIAPNGNINLANSTASVGNILKAGSRFIHSFGSANVFAGLNAGNFALTGSDNAAFGANALTAATTGNLNTAIGREALLANTTGSTNTAIGARTLEANIGGSENTALGIAALDSNTSGTRNIGIGLNGGASLTTGNHNIAIANEGVAGESGTIRLGDSVNQTRAFIAGIRGITTGSATGISVLIDTNGQLGTVSSSRNVKNHITDIGNDSDVLMNLRPVSFRYKSHDSGPRQYGLIAEEVAEVAPELVARREDGSVETVYYQHLPPMLLNEVQKQRRIVEALKAQNAAIAAENAALRADVASIKAALGLPPGLR